MAILAIILAIIAGNFYHFNGDFSLQNGYP